MTLTIDIKDDGVLTLLRDMERLDLLHVTPRNTVSPDAPAMSEDEYTIVLTRDDDAGVWIAESEDIPGLIMESGSFDTLIERVENAVPDLLELSGKEHTNTRLRFKAERLAVVA